jgi:hypothetical protein
MKAQSQDAPIPGLDQLIHDSNDPELLVCFRVDDVVVEHEQAIVGELLDRNLRIPLDELVLMRRIDIYHIERLVGVG